MTGGRRTGTFAPECAGNYGRATGQAAGGQQHLLADGDGRAEKEGRSKKIIRAPEFTP